MNVGFPFRRLQFLAIVFLLLFVFAFPTISAHAQRIQIPRTNVFRPLRPTPTVKKPLFSPSNDPHLFWYNRSAPPGYYIPVDLQIDSPYYRVIGVNGNVSYPGVTYQNVLCVPSFTTNSCGETDTDYYTQTRGQTITCVEGFIGRYWLQIPTTAPIGSQYTVDLTNISMSGANASPTPTTFPVPYTYTSGIVNVLAPTPGVCYPDAPARVQKAVTTGITSFVPSIEYKNPDIPGDTMKIHVFGKLTNDAVLTTSDIYYGYHQNGIWYPGSTGSSNYLLIVFHSFASQHGYTYQKASIQATIDGQPLTIYTPYFIVSSGAERMFALWGTIDGSTWHAFNAADPRLIPTIPAPSPTYTLVQKADTVVGLAPLTSIMDFSPGVGYFADYDGRLAGFCGNLPIYPGAPNCAITPTPTPGGPSITPTYTPSATPTHTPTGTPTPTAVPPVLKLQA